MRLYRSLAAILAFAWLQSAVAQDTVWMFREDTAEYWYTQTYAADTFPENIGPLPIVDTGDALEGKYVNFDYQFSNDFMYLIDSARHCSLPTGDTLFRGLRPGYAGFKFFWDCGAGSFWIADYDSIILWHKGPLPGHKVRMIWAQGSAGCGTPINYEYFGEFASSTSWTRESFPFPRKRNYGAAPDSPFVKTGLFELRMQIYNDSTITTDPTSPPGNLKIDNMFFFQPPAHIPEIWQQPASQTFALGSQVFLQVHALGGTGVEGEMTYLWRKDGNPLTETTSRYVIDSAQSSDAGTYTVVVTNSLGSVTSDAAILTVKDESDEGETKGCGCGAGTGTALIPPLFFKAMAHRKRKKKSHRT